MARAAPFATRTDTPSVITLERARLRTRRRPLTEDLVTGIWYVVGFAFAGILFVFLTIGLAWLISHRTRGDSHKGYPYESGIDTYGDTHARFGISFYIYALMFVAFDIEVIFIFLWALVFQRPAASGGARSRACWSSSASSCSGSPTRGARGCSRGADARTDRTRSPAGRRRTTSRRAPTSPARSRPRSSRAAPRDVTEPIVVPNTLWTSTTPERLRGRRGRRATPTCATLGARTSYATRRRAAGARSRSSRPRPTSSLDLIRMNSLWPLLSGLACCAIEMMSAATSKNDMDRWGMFPFRASPRQADVLIVAGTLTTKMAGPLVRLWEQMPEPKWCVAMGDCTCSGGRYKRSLQRRSRASTGSCPWTSTCPGCPPRPEGLIYGMMKLEQLVKERRGHWHERPIGPNVPTDV